jgi:uncharacterized protein (TIGR02145 family)
METTPGSDSNIKGMKQLFLLRLMIIATIAGPVFLTVSCKKTESGLATVLTSPITDKTAISAIGGGEVTNDGGTPVSERGVCWSLYENPTTADTRTSDGAGIGVFVSEITALTPDEVYHVKAYATNSAGTAYGSEVSFTASVADSGKSSFTDSRDGHEYLTQIIGLQTWMAENLSYLPAVSGPLTGSDSFPYYYVYGCDSADIAIAKDSANYKTYGVLYNWPAALVSCPAGWHLPSEAEWEQLIATIGSPAGGKLKEIGTIRKNAGVTHWEYPNTGATDEFGFDAIPGGERYSLGVFRYITTYAVFWSSTPRTEANSWSWHLFFDNDRFDRDWFSNSNGFSVRCVKN